MGRVVATWVCGFLCCLVVGMSMVVRSQQGCLDDDGDGFFAVAGCGTARDCNDQNLHIFPGAVKVCNGWDDNCDGQKDEGCMSFCTNPEHRLGDVAPGGSGGLDHGNPSMVRANHGYGIAWRQPPVSMSICDEIRFARLDEKGQIRTGPTVLRVPSSAGRASQFPHLTWTGRDFWVTWGDAPVADCTTPTHSGTYVQRIDPQGGKVGDPLRISCHIGDAIGVGIAWTGRHVVVLWVEGYGTPSSLQGLYLARLTPEGEVLDPCGVQIGATAGDPPGARSRIVWSGQELGVVWMSGDLYFQRFSEDLIPLDAAPHRITFGDERSAEPSLVWADGEWGLAWSENFIPGFSDIAFARLDAQGNRVDPPGVIRITFGEGGVPKSTPDIEWTGAEYGIFYLDETSVFGTGDIRLARVTAAGVHLFPDALLTTDAANGAFFVRQAWRAAP